MLAKVLKGFPLCLVVWIFLQIAQTNLVILPVDISGGGHGKIIVDRSLAIKEGRVSACDLRSGAPVFSGRAIASPLFSSGLRSPARGTKSRPGADGLLKTDSSHDLSVRGGRGGLGSLPEKTGAPVRSGTPWSQIGMAGRGSFHGEYPFNSVASGGCGGVRSCRMPRYPHRQAGGGVGSGLGRLSWGGPFGRRNKEAAAPTALAAAGAARGTGSAWRAEMSRG